MTGFNFKLSTWTAPHWLVVAGSAIGGAVVNYVATVPASELLSDLTTQAGVIALAKGAAIAGIAALVGVAKTLLNPAAQATKNSEAAAVKVMFPPGGPTSGR